MKIVPFHEIQMSLDRQRKFFDPVAASELRDSILEFGLLEPIIVREEGPTLLLVAGERRLKALRDIEFLGRSVQFNNQTLPSGCAPIVTLGEIPPLVAAAAELEENIRRLDLTWQERAKALSDLHRLREAQAQANGQKHTHNQTALEVFGQSDAIYGTSVANSLIVSRHLDDQDVQKAKSINDAVKILKRKEQATKHKELAEAIGSSLTKHSHSIYLADSIEWMMGQQSEQFDCILTDPPYGIDAQNFGDAGGKMAGIEHHYDDSYESWRSLMAKFAEQIYRLTKPQAHAYVFCDIANYLELHELMARAGWWVHRTPLIRHIPDGARVPWPEHGPRRAWEMILYAVKGKKPTISIQPDLIFGIKFPEETYGHGAQKPIELYRNLLNRTCRPGDAVLDPFAGTGTIFPAAHELKLVATGIEQNPEYYGVCLKRLEEL